MIVNCSACGAMNESLNNECQYCGNSLSIQTGEFDSKIKVLNEQGNKFKLAEVAFDGGDYDEAINYYNKCLEVDSDFFEAWYKKGLSILMTSTIGNFKSQQAISAFKQAINNSPNSDKFKKRFKVDVIPFICDYYQISYNHFNQFKELPNSGFDFSEKLNRANDTIEFIIDHISLDINEVKKIYLVINGIRIKVGTVINMTLFKKGGVDKVENDFNHVYDKLKHMEENKLLVLWQKLEPESMPQPKKGCFIATATMGNYDHPVVLDLRMFRDNWLLKRNWGVQFTDWYYTHGPKAAIIIERSLLLRKLTFILIVKPLQIITKKLK